MPALFAACHRDPTGTLRTRSNVSSPRSESTLQGAEGSVQPFRRLAGPGQSYRGHQAGLIAGYKTPGERAIIVAGRFERTDDSSIITGKLRDEPIVLSTRVQNDQPRR